MLTLVFILMLGLLIRRAILQLPELETVVWILVILTVLAVAAIHGRLTVMELP